LKGGAIGFYKKGGRTRPVHAKTGISRVGTVRYRNPYEVTVRPMERPMRRAQPPMERPQVPVTRESEKQTLRELAVNKYPQLKIVPSQTLDDLVEQLKDATYRLDVKVTTGHTSNRPLTGKIEVIPREGPLAGSVGLVRYFSPIRVKAGN